MKKATNKKSVVKKQRGMTEKVFTAICDKIANGNSLTFACKEHHISRHCFYDAANKNDVRRNKYARAREDCLDVWADEIIDISNEADEVANIESTGGNAVQAKKVRIDARKWILSKLLPKKYGDASKIEVTGRDGGPIESATTLTPEQFATLKAQNERVVETMKRKLEER